MKIKYRTWKDTTPPRKIKMEIPGWAGENTYVKAQPWHCKPFVDGCQKGIELVYPYPHEVRVRCNNGETEFIGDFSSNNFAGLGKPFATFADNHFGFTSSVDIKTEEGIDTMVLPHPRFYTDTTGTVPVPVMGLLETDWWSRIFFIVFKNPAPNQEYIFRYGEPFAYLLFINRKDKVDLERMEVGEAEEREMQDKYLTLYDKHLCTKQWTDTSGKTFSNKYKVLANVCKNSGSEGVTHHIIDKVINANSNKKNKEEKARDFLPRILFC